jgi:hypothetical protein
MVISGATTPALVRGTGNLAKQVSPTKYLMRGVDNPSASALVLLVTKTCANPGVMLHVAFMPIIG